MDTAQPLDFQRKSKEQQSKVSKDWGLQNLEWKNTSLAIVLSAFNHPG